MLIRIAGTGRALPAEHVTSASLDDRLGLKPGSLQRATGVEARYVCAEESQIDLATEAAHLALDDAGMSPAEIDLVVSGCAVPYQPIPATAPLVMRRLGIEDGAAAAFDINSTCLSFLTAFEVAARQVDAGAAKAALIVSSEIASRGLPWNSEPTVAALFGDGAAAAVITKAAPGEGLIRANLMRSYPSAYEACSIGAGGTRFDFRHQPDDFASHSLFQMDGKELFRISSRHFEDFASALLEKAGWTAADVDLLVPHQASPLALQRMSRRIGFSPDAVIDITASHGNQIAASIPFALDLARRQGRLPRGTKALFIGASAGVSFGGMAMEV